MVKDANAVAGEILNAARGAVPCADFELAELSFDYGEPFAAVANALAEVAKAHASLPSAVRNLAAALLEGNNDGASRWARESLAHIPTAKELLAA